MKEPTDLLRTIPLPPPHPTVAERAAFWAAWDAATARVVRELIMQNHARNGRF